MYTLTISEWTAALRSGNYKQGQTYLHNITEGTYCCLGVLCDLFQKKYPGVLESEIIDSPSLLNVKVERFKKQKIMSVLPDIVQAAIKLSSESGRWSGGSLIALNDCEGWTFGQIADLIDSKPEEMFRD